MYAFKTRLDTDFETAVNRATEALGEEGFGVLSEIDVSTTLKKKLGVDRRPYVILGACNPQLADRALEADPDIGVLLPCNVVVREDDDGLVTVVFMDPASVLNLVKEPGIEALAGEVKARLERARDALRS